jgi:hypothetical protein
MTVSTAPEFVSVELIVAHRQIRRLEELGYNGFKIISQLTLREPSELTAGLKKRLPAWAQKLVAGAESRLLRHRGAGRWRFPRRSSGPFGEDTHGEWYTSKQALELCRRLDGDLFDWCDIHARRSGERAG